MKDTLKGAPLYKKQDEKDQIFKKNLHDMGC